MKTIVAVLSCIFMLNSAIAQTPCEADAIDGYAACISYEDIRWKNQNEWEAWHIANLYLDGVLQEPSNDYYYRWYRQNDGVGDFILMEQAYGS